MCGNSDIFVVCEPICMNPNDSESRDCGKSTWYYSLCFDFNTTRQECIFTADPYFHYDGRKSSFRIIWIHAERLTDGEDIAVAASGLNHATGNCGPSRLRNKLWRRVAFGSPASPLSNASILKGIRQEMVLQRAVCLRALRAAILSLSPLFT
ncbi:hypothetical protein DFH06DRAFT_1122229 [Mycena polygramma]|nr:hypothetical protein DFH06DRAFT_1122229 [Mycena polygramma]